MSAAIERVRAAARAFGIEPEIREFPQGTRTAEDAARAVGCDVDQIVKSLVFLCDDEPVLVFVSGRHRLDTSKLEAVAGARAVRRATADEAKEATGFAIGGTPPFAHARPLRTFMDETLLDHDEVWAAAGTPSTVFALSPVALRDATSAHVASLHETDA